MHATSGGVAANSFAPPAASFAQARTGRASVPRAGPHRRVQTESGGAAAGPPSQKLMRSDADIPPAELDAQAKSETRPSARTATPRMRSRVAGTAHLDSPAWL